ncbi:hypothetical protein Tco_0597803 [Tanacetum coccineum]
MVSEICQLLKHLTFSAPSCGASSSTTAPTYVGASVLGGEKYLSRLKAHFVMKIPNKQLVLYQGTPSQPEGEHEPKIEEVLEEQMIESVKVSEVVEKTKVPTKEPQTKQIISTPIPDTTALETEDSLVKLKKASKKIRQDPYEAILIYFQLHDGRVVKMTHDEIDQYLENAEKVKNVELTKLTIGKVVVEEVKVVVVTINDGKDFLNHQAELLKEHNENVKKLADRNNLYDNLLLANVGINEWDELGSIMKFKKNKVVPDMLRPLSNMYANLKEIAKNINLKTSIPLPL